MDQKKLFLCALSTLSLACETTNARANLFVTTGNGKKTNQTCIPFADSIYIADSSLFVVSDTKVKSFPYKNVIKASVSLEDTIASSIIPASMLSCMIGDIPYLNDLSGIQTTAEEIITDSTKVGYADFIENAMFDYTVNILFGADSASVTGITDSIIVNIDKNYVTITSKEKNVKYVLSGKTADGGFKLYGDNRSCVTLNGVEIESQKGAAINVQSKKRCYIELADNTVNSLKDAEKYQTPEGEDEKAALFSEGQLCISGKGILNINANKKSALASDEYIHVCDGVLNLYTSKKKGTTIKVKENFIMGGGFLQVRADGDAGKAISSDSLLRVTGGKIVAITTGDVILAEDASDYSSAACVKVARAADLLGGEIDLLATGIGGKGINVGEVKRKGDNITIDGATMNVLTLGQRIPALKDQLEDEGMPSSSPKGIKAGYNLVMKSGYVRVNALGGDGAEAIECKNDFLCDGGTIMSYGVDDGVNAVNSTITGGKVFVGSSANDGFDCNGGIFFRGGEFYCIASAYMQGGLDNDGKTFGYDDGTLIAIGENNSSPWASKGNGCSVMTYLKHPAKYVAIKDATGKDVIVVKSTEKLDKQCVLIASPLLKVGESYSFYSAMEIEGGDEDWGVITGATLVNPTLDYEFEFKERTITLGSLK